MSKSVISHIAFALNCLLLFFVLADKPLVVPAWLQVAGRMHPLLLHFPMVLLLLAIGWEVLMVKQGKDPVKIYVGDKLLLFAALTAALSAVMGLLLSQEDGYDAESLSLHKWAGVGVSVIAYVWYAYKEAIRKSTIWSWLLILPVLLTIILAGHFGAIITHGENYLLEPVTPAPTTTEMPVEQAVIFANVVQPILEKKCMNCHNSTKAKGQLDMETTEALLTGGKNGVLWDIHDPQGGLMMERIHLPSEEKKHMPPAGKPQLTHDEIAILYQWIKSGADFTRKVMDLDPKDSLRILSEKKLRTNAADQYTFEAADESLIKKLNTNYRIIQPVSLHSPALSVTYYGTGAFTSQQLKELEPLREQIVQLHLNRMPVKDEDLKIIATFTNLRQLNLSFTNISGATLGELKSLKWLRSLALSGTGVKLADLGFLTSLPRLTSLYLWNTAIVKEELADLNKNYPDIRIDKGYNGDTVVAKLSLPIFKDEDLQMLSKETLIELKHYVKGAELRYTLDGTDPDSLKSPVYKDGVLINKSLVFKVKAFLPDWISSDILTKQFYLRGIQPDSSRLAIAPNPQYTGKATVLFDNKKGDFNFKSGKWLGFREAPLEVYLYFDTLTPVSSVTFSNLIDIGGFIMPPLQLEVWGGNNSSNLKLLKILKPVKSSKVEPAYLKGFECAFTTQKVKVLKLVGRPVPVLPAWHPGKGDKGWLFVDEIFIN